MKKAFFSLLTLTLLATATIALAAATAPLSTPELKQTIGANGKPTLVFFQNPNGGPCKAQKGILDKLSQDRKGNFNIASVNAMNKNDQKAFYDYGVRSLPSLVLVDKSGKISRVFPPGIQSQETLSASLDGVK
ncbi:thioredoxin family protein [Geobacter pelophilus]|uniref:Thioredoxin family protein n=1 Tax=Geoanaerobacter pelophilus TaxID=60036 RepID=A0AAW4LEU9_9BACT|nr:thioredoxin family protein [Geoanaerobacter pelophilus]MBT0666442.1 thioredoxin family protein [Geoanaerobacter pelophilus]